MGASERGLVTTPKTEVCDMLEIYPLLTAEARPPEPWSKKLIETFFLWGFMKDVCLCEWTRPGETLYTVSLGEPKSPCNHNFAVHEFKDLADAKAYFEDWKLDDAKRRP
jgi:hypothetical protein